MSRQVISYIGRRLERCVNLGSPVSQTKLEAMTLLTNDQTLSAYGDFVRLV